MAFEAGLLALVVVAAALTRPWRWLQHRRLHAPWLACSLILACLWALPRLHAMPLQLQWSGACLLVLLFGWPLAIPTLIVVAVAADVLAPIPMEQLVAQTLWLGAVPATLALAWGAVLRRYLGHQPFVYVLGRAFLGTVACTFAAGVLGQWSGHRLAGVDPDLLLVAHWLMAWGDGFLTGLLVAVFVAFKPEWLLTWSDRLYLNQAPD